MINIEEIQAQIKQYEQIKDWFKNRTDFRYNWNETC